MEEEIYNRALVVIQDIRTLVVEGLQLLEDYEKNLVSLSHIVTLSSQSQELRKRIESNSEILKLLTEIVDGSLRINIPAEESVFSYYIRVLRGILLLVRNLVISNQFIEVSLLLKNLQRFKQNTQSNNEFYFKTIVVYMQCLANLSHNLKRDNIVFEINQALFQDKDFMSIILKDSSIQVPFAMFLKNVLQISNNAYEVMTYDDTILRFIIDEFENTDIHGEELDQYSSLMILAYQNIISHESYNKWLGKIDNESDQFLKIMKLNQVVVTSREDWDNYQLTAMLAWIFDNFKIFSQKSKDILLSKIYDPIHLKHVHLNLLILLDCLSDLAKFESSKQFLIHYNAIEELLSLLRVVHENVERKTLKKQEKIEYIADKKEFPQVKSLIIEIIAYLVHESFDIQEKVRKLHGLELVLSNCMIDDNDPYIKERSIICIKFLLANNKKNQQFVADLEAKQAIDDNALRDVGYEIQIENGKVRLKQTEDNYAQHDNSK